jgi:large subunit ribosomal protein L19
MSKILDFSAQYKRHDIDGLKQGASVRIHQRITEGEKSRIQIFEGLVIRLNSGSHSDATFTVRKVVDGVGVEKIFPLHSSNIAKIEIKKQADVRRSKLYFMRKRSGKSANLVENQVGITSQAFEVPADEPEAQEPVETTSEATPVITEEVAAPAENVPEAPAQEQK